MHWYSLYEYNWIIVMNLAHVKPLITTFKAIKLVEAKATAEAKAADKSTWWSTKVNLFALMDGNDIVMEDANTMRTNLELEFEDVNPWNGQASTLKPKHNKLWKQCHIHIRS